MAKKVKTACEVDASMDGDEWKDRQQIKLRSHWNRGTTVEIEIADKKLFVDGDELITAIQKCMNR